MIQIILLDRYIILSYSSANSEEGETMKIIENIIPVLHVSSLQNSIQYYEDKLGFKLNWEDSSFAGVYRDGFGIMLHQNSSLVQQQVWIGLHEMDALYVEYVSSNVVFIQKPENHRWAYDMKIEDLDGNILWFGTEPKTD